MQLSVFDGTEQYDFGILYQFSISVTAIYILLCLLCTIEMYTTLVSAGEQGMLRVGGSGNSVYTD